MRPSRDSINLEICRTIAKRSDCRRGKVGCVITKSGRIVSTGYNGTIGEIKCEAVCNVLSACQHAAHAEANAIWSAAKEGISIFGATLYCTTCPCYECAKAIVQVGILKVIYIEEYRDTRGKLFLIDNGIIVKKYLSDEQEQA